MLCSLIKQASQSERGLRPVQTGNVWRSNTSKHCLVTKHFIVWPPCLMLFDRVWSCLIKFEGHQKHSIKQLKTFLLFLCLMGDVLFVWTALSNMFDARMRTTLVQRLVSIDTASCLRTSLVQYFKDDERGRSFDGRCRNWRE